MNDEKSQLQKRFDNILVMRGLACIGVVIFHYSTILNIYGGRFGVLELGARGPYVFFIISGFLAFAVENKEKNVGIKEYYIKRFFKLIPVYYLVIMCNIVFWNYRLTGNLPIDTSNLYWFRYFLCLNTTIPTENGFWFNLNASWTISAFVCFYLMVPFLVKYIKELKSSSVFFLITVVIAYIWNQYIYYGGFYSSIACLPFFALGIIAYYGINEMKQNKVMLSLLSVLLVIIVSFGYVTQMGFSIIFVSLLILSVNFEFKNKFVKTCFIIIGKYSYTIYLVHALVMGILNEMNSTFNISKIKLVLFNMLATIVLSYIVYNFVERPFYLIGKKIVTRST